MRKYYKITNNGRSNAVSNPPIEQTYSLAKQRYAELGVDTDAILQLLEKIPISIQCWQGDDVAGFESVGGLTDGGIMATGNYPGRARTPEELRADAARAMDLIPGKHRFSLHAIYLEHGGRKIERNEIGPEHFRGWMDWAADQGIALDFNPTFFSHPKAAGGFTLAARDEGLRRFWVEHGIACRKIGEAFGRRQKTPCVTNVWIPDGMKDLTIDRKGPREILRKSLDELFAAPIDPACNLDAVECKLFGIGSETYVVGSHEFYLGYAVENKKLLCLDAGHFHPTETIADKISSVLLFLDEILLHVSRGVRWDSDHVVILNDDLRAIAEEIVRGGFIRRVHIGLDFFDASINRVAAWVTGVRAMLKALLSALLEPTSRLREFETQGDYTSRLVMLEELKTLPFGAVWNYYCEKQGVPVGKAWLDEVKRYEKDVLEKREKQL
ncbi:MAG: L-rhamnose isomerase [Pirellulaceae bacterium]|nr:L-rhamnose isomerase [Pirellulaceae bacterium]